MKKRYLIVALCVALLVCALCPLMAGAEETSDTIRAGYASITIDPSQYVNPETGNIEPMIGLQMGGYGDVRLSTGTLAGDPGLHATCAALTVENETVLIIGVDLTNSNTTWSAEAVSNIVKAAADAGYTVDASDVFITASHTHSAPALDDDNATLYRAWVYKQLGTVAKEALENRVESTMTKGSIDVSKTLEGNPELTEGVSYNYGDPATRMNYIRHYKNEAGTEVWGSNFGSGVTRTGSTEVSEADDTMHLVMFQPTNGDADPIVLVNWRAHATMNSTTQTAYGEAHYNEVSADYVGALRETLKNNNEQAYNAVFIQGAAGNVVPNLPDSPFQSIHNPLVTGTSGSPEGHLYGAKLAEIALCGLKSDAMGDPLDTSFIRTATTTFDFYTHVPTSDEQKLIANMKAITPDNIDDKTSWFWQWNNDAYDTFRASNASNLYAFMATNWSSSYRSTFSEISGLSHLANIQSRYHLTNANSNLKYVSDGDSSLNVGAIAIGTQLSFVVSPCELSDRYSTSATLSDTSANDWTKLVNPDTFGTPLVMGYARENGGYMPNALAYSYNGGEGSYESQSADYAQGTGEKMIDFYDDLLTDINTTEGVRVQCECGGTAEGKAGHTCKDIEFLPWSEQYSLPVAGNYYLTTDVNVGTQHTTSGTLRLDLNGHNITTHVAPAQGPDKKEEKSTDENGTETITYKKTTHATRVFRLVNAGQLTITDSSDGTPGTIRRFLSNLTNTEQDWIDNYGLIILVESDATGGATVYNGVLDAEGENTGGGGVIANLGTKGCRTATVAVYGGTLKGGAAQKTTVAATDGSTSTSNVNGGVLFNQGNAYIYAGQILPYGYGVIDKETEKPINKAGTGGTVYNSGNLVISGGTIYGGYASYGGAVASTGTLTMTGGTITGGISNNGGAIYNKGTATLTGGSIIGNKTDGNGNCPGVYVVESGKLTIGGDVIIDENWKSTVANETNIRFASAVEENLAQNFTIQGTFTGRAGIYVNSKSDNLTIGISDNASFAPENFSADYNAEYSVVVKDGKLVLTSSTYAATVTNKMGTTPYTTLADAVSNAGSGDVITILKDCADDVTFPAGVTVDLFGNDLTGTVNVTEGPLFKDSRTDDYTTSDRYGYGKIKKITGTVKGVGQDSVDTTGDFYLPIKEDGGTSFHRVNLNIVGINLRPDSDQNNKKAYHPGAYYNAQLGGDEIVKAKIDVFGIALGANQDPNFARNTYSQFNPEDWTTGMSPDGSANNLAHGTLLKNILKGTNEDPINERNADIQIKGQAYIEFTDGSRIKGPIRSCSLKEIMEGKEPGANSAKDGITSVVELWDNLSDTQRSGVSQMYYRFCGVMDDWSINNIKENDDGILKVLALNTDVTEIRNVFAAELGENYVIASFASNSTSATAAYNDGTDSSSVTLAGALKKHDWDYVVLPSGTNIQTLSSYIKENDPNQLTTPKIAYNLGNTSEYGTVSSQVDWVIPSCTAVQNATTNTLTGNDAKVTAYTWYCSLTGTAITDCAAVSFADNDQRNIFMEAVNNAINKPNTVTTIQDDGVLKVLVIGHSLGVDSSYLFPAVAKANNANILVGTLYHSGCKLKQHADFIQGDLEEYSYLEFDTAKQDYWYIWDKTQEKLVQHDPNQHHDEYIGVNSNTSGYPNKYGVTMEFAIERHDWDVVIMMAGSSEATGVQMPGNVLSLNNLKIVRDHVLANDCDPTTMPMFAWNLTWAYPETATTLENSTTAEEIKGRLDTYFNNNPDINNSEEMYQEIVKTARDTVLPAYHFDYLLPNGTALQNARSKYAEAYLYRDRVHATDYMRLMAGATWYSVLTGTDANSVVIPTTIADELTHTDGSALSLTTTQITDLKTAVGNAIANPYSITPIS